MTIDVKGILNAGVAAQSATLAVHNLKGLKKKQTPKSIIKKGVTNLVGIPLIQAQSKIIGAI